MRNLSPVSPPPGPGPVPSASHVTTHVEKAGGFGGLTLSSPTLGGTLQSVLTGTATTFDTTAAAAAVGQDDLTTMRWYRIVAPAEPGVSVIAERCVVVWSRPDVNPASRARSTT